MKRRQRRPVLELNQSQSGNHGEHTQSKRKHTNNDHHEQNAPANPLANLLCHYNSDSDTEESKKDCKLDDQVNNFFKEIQLIAPKQPATDEPGNAATNARPPQNINQQALMWRECLDESSGYPYYWHIETNEVTWEMPEELRYLKNSAKANSAAKPPSTQESHWVDFSSVTYQQSHENIPEGMIPREVVARNRNRYICNDVAQKQDPQTDHDTTNTSDTMDNDSDDGKIEMITSYGSEESDSETGDEKEAKTEAPSAAEPKPRRSVSKSRNTVKVPAPVIQPQLPATAPNSTHEYKTTEATETDVATDALRSKSGEDAEAKHSRNQTKHQSAAEEVEEYPDAVSNENRGSKESLATKNNVKRLAESDVDFRVSLVPGYDEDSDAEEESEVKLERKALFPIPQTEQTVEIVASRKVTVDESRTTDSNDSDTNGERGKVEEQDSGDVCDRLEIKEEASVKPEEDPQKGNKFLDNFHGRNKFFQRKKRIAFDVPSVMAKTTEEAEPSKPEVQVQREETNSCDGNPGEPEADQSEESARTNENVEENTQNSKDESNNTDEEASAPETQSDAKEDEAEVNLLSQIILEKLKFLSEGKPGVSPVQTMSIQLQTLVVAWEAGCLEKNYLRRWLTDTSHELERLEQDAAPPGWLCQWDRSHKQYYYQNTTTGITQWTYPDTGIAGGAEEMEICSTPPPTEQEEIIVPADEDGSKSKPKKQQESGGINGDMTGPRNSDVEAPPPPQISNPSPPPPPRIYAEDLNRDKRKQDKGNEKLDVKKQRLGEEGATMVEAKQLENTVTISHPSALLSPQPTSLANVTTAEPLPPGVDLTEAPYEISATALKRIIYGAVQPQGAALYDASGRDPTVPILSHPAAIVQEHYLQYPAYHQHLHAPAALVLPHKHGVQPAIQLIPDYTPLYANHHKVIEKPPVKTAKESLVSALDSFYSDIARIENVGTEKVPQREDVVTTEPPPVPMEEAKIETEPEQQQQQPVPVEATMKEKKRKRARIGISKKHKEVSSMVAKWQKVQQNFENT